MATDTRQIVVDDTDPTIHYNGPWFLATGATNNSVYGKPFGNTLHGVNVNASFSYTFRGSQLTVFGTVDAGGDIDPSWACFIDGQRIVTGWLPVLPANNVELCENSAMSDALHTLTVQVTVTNSSKTFWFDSFQYVPVVNAPSDNVTVVVTHSDASILYGPGWGMIYDGTSTQLLGTKVTLEFIGDQVTWFGMRMNTSLAPTSATYSIDGATPISFPLAKPSPSLPDPSFNQIIFQTGKLSLGKHRLEVFYGGNAQSIPLSLEAFIIRNATVVSSSPNNTFGVGPTDLPPNSAPKMKPKIGLVIGGVFGTVIIISVLLFLLHYRRPRRKPRIEPFKMLNVRIPFPITVQNLNTSIPVRQLTITEQCSPSNRMSFRPILIQTTGKVVRTDGILETASVTSGSDEDAAPIQNLSLPVRMIRHEDSGLRLPEREDDSVVEPPPLYTAA
ncbi:hypothetical protein GALMADRAFT_144059 [Galerina marginata CBS 339.88]|uniref:Transmembrane protein n=1 Tax=Galerina marginata (strain CBS 339.88) TaxID=685588 RepID=A0A067SUK7_GALM3|nr:hypothetical protein GALMADRAFT_144059 [Galerina marginata CBS 339.88]